MADIVAVATKRGVRGPIALIDFAARLAAISCI
jgi:hypothetical protein